MSSTMSMSSSDCNIVPARDQRSDLAGVRVSERARRMRARALMALQCPACSRLTLLRLS